MLLGVPYVARTSGTTFSFVLERLSNTLARLPEALPCTPDWYPIGAMGGGVRASDGPLVGPCLFRGRLASSVMWRFFAFGAFALCALAVAVCP